MNTLFVSIDSVLSSFQLVPVSIYSTCENTLKYQLQTHTSNSEYRLALSPLGSEGVLSLMGIGHTREDQLVDGPLFDHLNPDQLRNLSNVIQRSQTKCFSFIMY